jgi:hypothetical protein
MRAGKVSRRRSRAGRNLLSQSNTITTDFYFWQNKFEKGNDFSAGRLPMKQFIRSWWTGAPR